MYLGLLYVDVLRLQVYFCGHILTEIKEGRCFPFHYHYRRAKNKTFREQLLNRTHPPPTPPTRLICLRFSSQSHILPDNHSFRSYFKLTASNCFKIRLLVIGINSLVNTRIISNSVLEQGLKGFKDSL